MISFNSNTRLETAFKNSTLCYIEKPEKDIFAEGMLEIYKELEPIKDKIKYIAEKVNEKVYDVIALAMYIYPNKNLKKAIEQLYEDLKLVDEKFAEIEEEPIIKSARTSKDVEDEVVELGKNKIAKAYYIKEAIKATKECALF